MVRFMSQWMGRCAAAVLVASATAMSVGAADEGPELGQPSGTESVGSIELLSRAVNGELSDVAGALRGLDQSYVYRGMQGCGSATAGSVFIDWDAKGVPEGQRVRVLPPQPLVLSESSKKKPCTQRDAAPQATPQAVQPTQPTPSPAPPCNCQSATPSGPLPAPQAATPACSHCGGRSLAAESWPVVPQGDAAGHTQPQRQERLAEVYYHGQRQCGGRVPPQVMSVHGQWAEIPAGWQTSGYAYPTPGVRVVPQGYGAPVW